MIKPILISALSGMGLTSALLSVSLQLQESPESVNSLLWWAVIGLAGTVSGMAIYIRSLWTKIDQKSDKMLEKSEQYAKGLYEVTLDYNTSTKEVGDSIVEFGNAQKSIGIMEDMMKRLEARSQ